MDKMYKNQLKSHIQSAIYNRNLIDDIVFEICIEKLANRKSPKIPGVYQIICCLFEKEKYCEKTFEKIRKTKFLGSFTLQEKEKFKIIDKKIDKILKSKADFAINFYEYFVNDLKQKILSSN